MKAKELFYLVKPPCGKCLYRLGLIHTLVNPCPQCRENHYAMYDRFCRERAGERPEEHPADTKKGQF